ncbi:MAG: hypothetical protein GWN01_15340 [Nitrosopumilaceae archaeon]|nr:hypothetical protein [Nitrosopumilaceae archaeon]NIU87500.1 hypothetical protein [Nitrosopumilaceae archaeon]NIX62817.1 hypothetical protein [Nitrosopumilaceae archaeon]
MAISRNFNGASIRKPGAYSRNVVNLSGGFPLAPTGVVAIVGEAEGGAPGATSGVQTFTSEDIGALTQIYKSGPIVDAARILTQPARDPRVANGAGLIRVYKTNASTQSTLALENASATTLYNLQSANYGEDENLISVTIEAGTDTDARIITVQKGADKEVLSENPRNIYMSIQYTGGEASADMTIQGNTLAVDTGGADDININLTGKTIQQVVDIIDANANYTASTSLKLASVREATDLDPISTNTDVKTAVVDIYAQQKEILDIINAESSLVTATKVADVEGIVATISKTFMSGAAKGASTNSNFQNGFDALLAERCNTVVPLISRDATDLASDGLTDSSSTFEVDAVNLQAVTHCITASNTKNRSERNCYVSVKDTFANTQTAAQDINSERASMLFQDVEVLNSNGNLAVLEPWAASCILAGIQAGTDVGTPATFKGINVNSISHSDYNSKTQIDLAIDAGLTPLEERDSGGFRVVVHNTTYSTDANFVFNRVHVLEAADTVAYNLRQQLEAIFVGTKGRTGTADAIYNTIVSIMQSFLDADIIVGDDTNAGKGFKDLTVVLNGNAAEVDITITPVQGIDFILATIRLDNVRQTAGA